MYAPISVHDRMPLRVRRYPGRDIHGQPVQDKPDAIPGDGKCSYLAFAPDNTAVCTLRAAIMEANATSQADTVLLQDGATYVLSIEGRGEAGSATGDLNITAPLTIYAGLFGRATIDANGIDRVIRVQSSDVTLYGLNITGGSLDDGDEMTCDPSGGINADYFENLQLTLVRVYGNDAGCDGAVVVGPSAKLRYCEIFSNSGIGIRAVGGNLEIDASSVHDNGFYDIDVQNGGSLLLTSSTVSHMAPSFSYGIRLRTSSSGTIANSTIVSNQAALSVQQQSRLFMANTLKNRLT